MADEVPAGSLNLEADEAAPAETPPAPAPVAETPAPVDAVEVAGRHYIPVAAIQDEREKRQAAEARAAQLEQQVQQQEPIVALLRNNPGLLQRPAPPVDAPPDPVADPDALEVARLMDFYQTDGTPDAARGARYLALQDRRAQVVASKALAPLTQQTARERADLNFQKALAMHDPSGQPIDPQTLTAVWRQVQSDPNGTAILADPQAAAFVAAAALGIQTLTRPGAGPAIPPAKPPLVTEGSGGSGGRRASISELETRVAGERGRNPDQWATLTKGHQAGRPNLVEE